jgi:hypothetical protein
MGKKIHMIKKMRTDKKLELPKASLLLVVIAVAAAPFGPPSWSSYETPRLQDSGRLEGESGLFVAVDDDVLDVRWFTAEPDSGFLMVRAATTASGGAQSGALESGETAGGSTGPVNGAGAAEGVGADHVGVTTPVGRVHAASLPRPAAGPLVLSYGAASSQEDRHSTTIWPTPERSSPRFDTVDSLFVVGDVHGEYEILTTVLRNAGLIDREGRWSGGRSHLVFLGDLFDRGEEVTRTLWFIYGLERQAESAGGRVHVVLGNHEIMVLTYDLRYVAAKELHVAEAHGTNYSELFDVRRSVLGQWLASKPALIQVGPVLMAHGGVSPAYAGYRLEEFDDSLAAFMSSEWFYRWGHPADSVLPPIVMDAAAAERRIGFFFDANSVFWYRDYVMADTLREALDRVLDRYESKVHVIAHTPVGNIGYRYGGALLAVDLRAAASQLLLLARDGMELRAFRYGMEGPPEPL